MALMLLIPRSINREAVVVAIDQDKAGAVADPVLVLGRAVYCLAWR